MIVDDDTDDCEFFCEAVAECDSNAECLVAHNGEEALKTLNNSVTQLPELIFLDLNMPRMDGKTCLAELKKSDTLKNIPVIIYSTSSSQNDKEETQKLGASHFLTKPSDYKKLCSEISRIIQMDWSK